MRYVRTDAPTPYYLWMNSSWIIYNPPTSRFFVTDPDANRIFVLDSTTEAVVGTIIVPGAFGIDDTADHSTLYVGTQIGDVYAIDPVGMTVTKRYEAAQIGPNGFHANLPRVMADGRLALLGGQGGIPGVDGYSGYALWNPADNSISIYTTEYGAGEIGMPATVVCGTSMGNIGMFSRTPDRTKVIIASIDSDGTLCEINEATGASTYVNAGAGFIWHMAISPDGNWIVLPAYPGQAIVYNAGTLAQVAKFEVAGDTSSGAELFIGPDSQTLYVSSNSDVYAYNFSNGQQVGWFPNIVVTYIFSGGALGPAYGPQFQAMDGTGLLVGPMQEGVGFLDTTALRTGAVGTQYLNNYVTPNTGPSAGGTITNVYFGTQPALSTETSGHVTATTPPGAPGPADVYSLASDGGIQLLPEAFSYGPTVLEITPNAATAEGGPGVVYGYGFGPMDGTTLPSGVGISVGDKSGTPTAFDGDPYTISGQPFPLNALSYTIPAGAVGKVAVTVSVGSESVTVPNAFTYLPATQQYPLSGSSLAQGVYDSLRDVYYFTDATQIQVFSKTAGAWMSPISIPAADKPQRLWGLALSTDGSKLAIADALGEAIYVLNPGSPSAVQKFSVPQFSTGTITNPVGVAISDAGIVYFTVLTAGGTGYYTYFKLDTNSGQITNYQIGTNSPQTDSYLRTLISADNTLVYGNDDGEVVTIDTATDGVSYAKDDPGCCYGDYDMSLSGNQTVFAASEYFYDSILNAES
jgi:hypothetical protein